MAFIGKPILGNWNLRLVGAAFGEGSNQSKEVSEGLGGFAGFAGFEGFEVTGWLRNSRATEGSFTCQNSQLHF